ncbi:MAG: DUF3090 family protein [Ktedonobacteraceae bacterium]|nr:DUF3090 family protein [Ktedonobacteraceae bacterium]
MSRDLGPVSTLGADAVGQPGQRRFRFFARSERGSAIFWVEKEYLNSLALTLDRALAVLSEGQILRPQVQVGQTPDVESMPTDFPIPPTYDFQVGELRLSFVESEGTFQLTAVPFDILMEPGEEPQLVLREQEAVSLSFTQQDAYRLSRNITAVIAAGRPTCPFCGAPLDDGPHACVKQNGHQRIIPLDADGEGEGEEGEE